MINTQLHPLGKINPSCTSESWPSGFLWTLFQWAHPNSNRNYCIAGNFQMVQIFAYFECSLRIWKYWKLRKFERHGQLLEAQFEVLTLLSLLHTLYWFWPLLIQFNNQALQVQPTHMWTGFDRAGVNKFWSKQTNLALDQAIHNIPNRPLCCLQSLRL